MKRRIIAVVLATLFLSVMFGGLFHFSNGMEMEGGESAAGCPLMSHEETICPMSVLDHIGAWKDTFVAIVPEFVGLIIVLGLLATVVSQAPNLLLPQRYFISQHLRRFRKRRYTFIYRFWQELFSSGILNPKLF